MKPWTVSALLRQTQEYFRERGIDSARLDAELLLAAALGRERIALYLDAEYPLSDTELSVYREMVRRRARHEPIAYILGYREFWTERIKTCAEVLVPRPETEVVVEETLRILQQHCQQDRPPHLLDIGTGSGAIVSALCREVRDLQVVATDVSLSALRVAGENLRGEIDAGQVRLVCADMAAGLRQAAFFDVVVSNPPYIPSTVIDNLAPEVRAYEPRLALDGGPDGLAFYWQLAGGAPGLLRPGGWLVVEIGADQTAAVKGIFEKARQFDSLRVVTDYARHDRVCVARTKNSSATAGARVRCQP